MVGSVPGLAGLSQVIVAEVLVMSLTMTLVGSEGTAEIKVRACQHPGERLCSTVEGYSVLWRDTISTVKGYHQYCEGIPSVLWRDTISTE